MEVNDGDLTVWVCETGRYHTTRFATKLEVAGHHQSIVFWVLRVTLGGLPLSQSKTLAELVAATVHGSRANLAEIGRSLARCQAMTTKAAIKRAWQFTTNERVEVTQAMAGVIAQLTAGRTKPLIVSFDGTQIRSVQLLAVADSLKGRAVPLLWCCVGQHPFRTSQNAAEEALLLRLRTLVPEGARGIVLADRGFGRAAWAQQCQLLGFDYLVRICPNVTVRCDRYSGQRQDYPTRLGIAHLLRRVRDRAEGLIEQNVVIHWPRGLPKRRNEPWFLMTNLGEGRAQQLCHLYGKRMSIEGLFGDAKNHRNGWSLRHTKMTDPQRFERFLLIL